MTGYTLSELRRGSTLDGCAVSSIRLTTSGSITGSMEQTVQVLLSSTPTLSSVEIIVTMITPGYSSIYAVGYCEDKVMT